MLAFDQDRASSASQSASWVGIVDDDEAVRSSLRRVLRMEGMCVETFASGEEFLERTMRGLPSCLVLDVRLGEFTGFDLQDSLLARGEVPPIIFITAHDEIPAARRDPCVGTAGYLRKPFDVAALVSLVRPLLRERATHGVVG